MVAVKTQFEQVHETSLPEHTLVLVGTALDGPSRVPFRVNRNLDIMRILGDSPLSRAFDLVDKAGSADVILYRLNGDHATCFIDFEETDPVTGQETRTRVLEMRSVSAHDDTNNILIEIDGYFFSVTDTNGVIRSYDLNLYQTAKDLAYAVNRDASYGLLEFEIVKFDSSFSLNRFISTPIMSFFSGGSSGIDLIPDRASGEDISSTITLLKQKLMNALFSEDPSDQENYEVNTDLGLLDYGVISLVGMFHDDEAANFTEILGNFCLSKTLKIGQGCIGVIGTSPIVPPVTTEAVKAKVKNLISLSIRDGVSSKMNDISVDVDYLSHVQVVVGDVMVSTPYGYSIESAAYSYASLQAYSPIQVSLTNKGLAGFQHLSYELNKEDVDSLLSNGYISIVGSIRRGFVPYRSTTYLVNGQSFYTSPHALRIAHYLSRSITSRLDSVIGQTISPLTKAEIRSRTATVLESILTKEIVRDYSYGFEYSERNTELRIKLSILPYSEVRKISSIVRLPFPRGVII